MFEFPKNRRLLKRSEFQKALGSRAKVVTPYMVVLGIESGDENSRMGLIVSRKVGIAVVRNKVKRLLRESFRMQPGLAKSVDFVVIARKAAAGADYDSMSRSLEQSLRSLSRKLVSNNSR